MATGDSTAQRAFWKVFEASVKATRQLKTVRAAELSERAADAAAALYGADSLVLARIQADAVLCFQIALGAMASTSARAVMQRKSLLHLRSTVELLQRRKAAGSPFPGRCRPEEEAFDRENRALLVQLGNYTESSSLPQLRQLNSCVGVRELAMTAQHAAHLLAVHCAMSVSERFLTAADTQLLLDFCVDTLELFASPAADAFLFGVALSEEVGTYEQAQQLVRVALVTAEVQTFRRVADALSELECRGVPQRRDYARLRAEGKEQQKADFDAARAAHAGRALRTCALPSCGAAELHPDQFKRCAACGGVHYCCKEHQTAHWPEHKAACKAARRAAEAAAAEEGAASASAR